MRTFVAKILGVVLIGFFSATDGYSLSFLGHLSSFAESVGKIIGKIKEKMVTERPFSGENNIGSNEMSRILRESLARECPINSSEISSEIPAQLPKRELPKVPKVPTASKVIDRPLPPIPQADGEELSPKVVRRPLPSIPQPIQRPDQVERPLPPIPSAELPQVPSLVVSPPPQQQQEKRLSDSSGNNFLKEALEKKFASSRDDDDSDSDFDSDDDFGFVGKKEGKKEELKAEEKGSSLKNKPALPFLGEIGKNPLQSLRRVSLSSVTVKDVHQYKIFNSALLDKVKASE